MNSQKIAASTADLCSYGSEPVEHVKLEKNDHADDSICAAVLFCCLK